MVASVAKRVCLPLEATGLFIFVCMQSSLLLINSLQCAINLTFEFFFVVVVFVFFVTKFSNCNLMIQKCMFFHDLKSVFCMQIESKKVAKNTP